MTTTETALRGRVPLNEGTVLRLQSTDGGKRTTFTVGALLGAGGTSLVYRAVRRGKAGDVGGSLKEFYPAADAAARGALPAELCRARAERLRRMSETLRTLKQDSARGLRFFLPYTELFLDPESSIPYVFTPENPDGVTLQDYCAAAWQAPNRAALLQILHTLYALACADAGLCRAGLLLLDITPANTLLIARNTDGEAPRFLRDAVSLFDVESIVRQDEVCQEGLVLPAAAGFTAPELGGPWLPPQPELLGPAADVYALAATLFYCLTGGESAFLDTAAGYAARLRAGPFGPTADDSLWVRLGELLEGALAYEPRRRRPGTPAAFAAALADITAGIEFTDAESAVARGSLLAARMPTLLTDLLYRCPPYDYGEPRSSRMKVLIAGDDDAMLLQAVRAVFSCCHVAKYTLHVQVAAPNARALTRAFMDGIDHGETWFCYADAEGADTDYLPWTKYLGALSWTTLPCSAAAAAFEPGTVLLLSRRSAAVQARAVPAPRTGRRLVAYTDPDEGCSLFAEADGSLVFTAITPDFADDCFAADAKELGFGTHLAYEQQKNPAVTEAYARRMFYADPYMQQNSLDTALAVKCRMRSLGLPWHDDPAQDAAAYTKLLANAPAQLRVLAFVEQRRWCADQLCRGVHTLPTNRCKELVEGAANGNGTKLVCRGTAYHLYLTPSAWDESRPNGWRTAEEWLARVGAGEPVPARLDPLSCAGVALADACIHYAPTAAALVRDDLHRLETAVAQLLPLLTEEEGHALHNGCAELTHRVTVLLQRPQPANEAIAACRIAVSALAELLDRLWEEHPRCARCSALLEDIRSDLFPLCYVLAPVDPKLLNEAVVRDFPPVYTYRAGQTPAKRKGHVLTR